MSKLSQHKMSTSRLSANQRVGLYAWGGPGTLRLLETKYHQPKINRESFLRLYDVDYLEHAQKLFGVTDAWVTYSWGFTEATEQEDRQFIVQHLPHFQQLGIKTHAYIQGLNVVSKDFLGSDLFSRDPRGHVLSYSKGRSFICPNNPAVQALILQRVQQACQENFNGIYIDNILFGLPPFYVSRKFTPFFGCACQHCQQLFQDQFGYALPVRGFNQKTLTDFLAFRVMSTQRLLARIFTLTQAAKKELGINLYDPYLLTPELYYGYSLEMIEPFLSYYLIENHQHPAHRKHRNLHLQPLMNTAKPVFIVSYKKGIGAETQFKQKDIDAVFAEAQQLHYMPCLKVTEFTTRGMWHTLDLATLSTPRKYTLRTAKQIPAPKMLPKGNFVTRKTAQVIQKYYAQSVWRIHENRYLAILARKSGIYQKQLRAVKKYLLTP